MHRARLLFLTLALGCAGAATSSPPASDAPSVAPSVAPPVRLPVVRPSFADPLPADGTATEVPIVVTNPGSTPRTLDLTGGKLASIGVTSLERPLGFLYLGDSSKRCVCPCRDDGSRCVQCEPPRHETVEVPPGGSVTLP